MSDPVSTSDFISQRKEEIKVLTEQLKFVSEKYSPETLRRSPAEGKWSVAQVLDHLNGYNRYYLAAIEAQLDKPAHPHAQETLSGRMAGRLFYKVDVASGAGKKDSQNEIAKRP